MVQHGARPPEGLASPPPQASNLPREARPEAEARQVAPRFFLARHATSCFGDIAPRVHHRQTVSRCVVAVVTSLRKSPAHARQTTPVTASSDSKSSGGTWKA